MEIHTKVIDPAGILEVVYSPGPVTQMELKSHRDLVASILRERGLKKVLIDGSAITPLPSTLTLFEHGEAIAEHCTLQKVQIAAVYHEVDRDIKFAEIVATNRGACIRCFPSRNEALAWIDRALESPS